jgi:2-hydroxychromene-2-carboxylate isomerase
MIQPEFLFDFGSPNAYLVHRVLPQIEARLGTRFVYKPVLLGGLFKLANNRPPMVAFGDIPKKMAYEQLETQRFVEHHKLNRYRFNPHFPVNTLNLMRGAFAAQSLGVLPAYVEAVFCAMWEDQKPMADLEVMAEVLTDAGLDAQGLMDLSQTPEIKAGLMAATQEAYDRGAFGIPSFLVGNELFFGKERLGQVEAEILKSA